MGYRWVHEHVQGWITGNVAGHRLLIAFLSPSFTVHTLLTTTNADHDTITLRLAQTVIGVTHGTADNTNNVHLIKTALDPRQDGIATTYGPQISSPAVLSRSHSPPAPPQLLSQSSAGVRVARQLWLLYAPQLGHHHWTLGLLRV
jgi:hypothetical protein